MFDEPGELVAALAALCDWWFFPFFPARVDSIDCGSGRGEKPSGE